MGPTARQRVYRDQAGCEVFVSNRRRIEMLSRDEVAEAAALRVAVAKWGAVRLTGSQQYRE